MSNNQNVSTPTFLEGELANVNSLSEFKNIDFESFACEMLSLDESFLHDLDSDPMKRESYLRASFQEKTTYHSDDIVGVVNEVFQNAHSYLKRRNGLALSIYKFCELTNAKYEQVSKVLLTIFGTTFSKSYTCKLYLVGKLITEHPELSNVGDIEKLVMLSKVSKDNDLANDLDTSGEVIKIKNCALNNNSRGEVKKSLAEAYPGVFRRPSSAARISQVTSDIVVAQDSPEWTLVDLKDYLERHQVHLEVYEDIKLVISTCISLIQEKLKS